VILTLLIRLKGIFLHLGVKKIAKIICNTKISVTLEEFAGFLYIKAMQRIEKFWGYDLETVLASRW
jgi:hypothetical protein